MATVKLSSVYKSFGKVDVVKDANLFIDENKFFTFLGPSGCGKTTILRMIAGFYYPTKGNIYFNDKEVTNIPPNKRQTGMVFQNYALFPHMSVFENVSFGLKVRKLASNEIKKRVDKYLALVRLDGYEKRKVTELSGGQQQRVALARSLVIEPNILLLDEPLSNLDAKLREEMRIEIKSLQRQLGITTIYVTHDQTEALTMSDQIAVFDRGVCQQVGSPDDIYNAPANTFVAQFIGETNLIECLIESRDDKKTTARIAGETVLEIFNSKHGVKDDRLNISIRPECIDISSPSKMGQKNIVKGKVSGVLFNGATVNYSILVSNMNIKVTKMNSYNCKDIGKGDNVDLYFPEDKMLLIK